jgi:hypothetical protein
MMERRKIAISKSESKVATTLHRVICPLHLCSSANLVAAPQEMFNPSIDANIHTATRPNRLLQMIFAVLLSVENRRFIKKMTEHFVRAFEMRKRSILAITDLPASS